MAQPPKKRSAIIKRTANKATGPSKATRKGGRPTGQHRPRTRATASKAKPLYLKALYAGYGIVIIAVSLTLLKTVLTEPLYSPEAHSGTYSQSNEAYAYEEETPTDITAIIESFDGSKTIDLSHIDTVLPKEEAEVWRTNGVQATLPAGGANLAIIIDDLGLDEVASHKLALLDGPLTGAFLPYAEHLRDQTTFMRAQGHELMVHMPMQPKNPNADPGTNALLEGISVDEFERRIAWNLQRFDHFVGVNNHMGSKLTENPDRMVRVMARLKEQGLMFVDSLTSARTVGPRAAAAVGVPFLKRDVFIDNERDVEKIIAQLEKAARIARTRGQAIAIGHPYSETLAALKSWLPKAQANGIRLVSVSQLMKREMALQAENDNLHSQYPVDAN